MKEEFVQTTTNPVIQKNRQPKNWCSPSLLRRLCGVIALCGLLFGAGCSNESGGTEEATSIRFVHAALAVPEMEFAADGSLEASNLQYGEASEYRFFSGAPKKITVYDAGLTEPILEFDGKFSSGEDYTVVIISTPTVTGFKYTPYIFLDDLKISKDEGEAKVRVINASTATGAVDAYLVRERDTLTARNPTAGDLVLGEASDYITRFEGDYDLRFTKKGEKSVIAKESGISLDGQSVNTALLLNDRQGDGELDVVLLEDEN